MDFNTYLQMPIKKRVEFILTPIENIFSAPLWQERLNTAITKYSPLAVSFDKQLINEYWTIKKQMKK
ncbi:hypothetical protein [Chryseobacterium sp.]|uniref:hypothetical protein n=1 Tax=Chryseobacterium sp. TaxID=1871047 RepID=UPI0035B14F7E